MYEEYLMYLRKSQADNPNETVEQVLEKHETQLQEFAESELGYRIPEEHIYREVVSGETIKDRVMIKEVLKIIESGNIKGVIVIEPQRLGRGDLEDCGKIVNSFRYSSTLIMTPVKNYDLSDKYDRKFFEMELQRGSDYLEYYKEIQARGRLASVKRGNYIGSIPPYGYRKIQIKEESGKKAYTLEPIPEEAAIVQKMYELFTVQNYGFVRIANYLDNTGIPPRKTKYWSPAAIKDMLSNPVYIGKIRWNWRKTNKVLENGNVKKTRPKSSPENWIIVDGKHPGIISTELFNAAIDKHGKNIRVKNKTTIRNPWSGIIHCKCGRAMVYRLYQKNKKQVSNPRLLCNGQSKCFTKSILYSDFEDAMIDIMKKDIADFEIILKNDNGQSMKSHQSMITALENELSEIIKKDERQHDLLEDGVYTKDIFLKRNAKLQERKQELLKSIKELKSHIPTDIDYKNKIITFQTALDSLSDDEIPAEQKNAMLKKCFKDIVYSRVDGEIHLDVYRQF